MRADLSLQQTPPFSVPARFFLSAPLFSIAAALILMWNGPEMFSSRWTPVLLAVTHLLTLGFLAMSMTGAIQQLLPVLMGVSIPWANRFSSIVHATLFTGCVSLALAWLGHFQGLFLLAIGLLGFSLSLFVVVTIERLARSNSTHATRITMLLALIALAVTAALGMRMVAAYGWSEVSLARHYVDLHIGWGILGWVMILVMAVAYQVIPMFQITEEYPPWHRRWLGPVLFIALALLSLGHADSLAGLKIVAKMTLLFGLTIFSVSSLIVLYRRRRKLPDVTLNFWYLAFSCLLLTALLWLIDSVTEVTIPSTVIGIIIITGFAMSAVNGMMYKIIPFIIWLHLNIYRTDTGLPQKLVPNMRQIMPEYYNRLQLRLHVLSLILLIMIFLVSDKLFYPATVSLFLSQGLLLANLISAVERYSVIMTELHDRR